MVPQYETFLQSISGAQVFGLAAKYIAAPFLQMGCISLTCRDDLEVKACIFWVWKSLDTRARRGLDLAASWAEEKQCCIWPGVYCTAWGRGFSSHKYCDLFMHLLFLSQENLFYFIFYNFAYVQKIKYIGNISIKLLHPISGVNPSC